MRVQPKPINKYPLFIRAFCVDINGATLEKRGVDQVKILALHDWRNSDLFSPRERIALEYTEAVTYTDGKITDEIAQGLRAHFDEDGIVELTGLIAFQNLSSKFNAALDIPPQGFCQLPELEIDQSEHIASLDLHASTAKVKR